MELTPEQVMIVGFVASVLSVIVKLISAKLGVNLSKAWMTVIVGGVSLVLAVLFNLPAIPAYSDPLQYLAEWLTILSGYVGFATIIYNIVIDKVLDKMKFTSERFLKG